MVFSIVQYCPFAFKQCKLCELQAFNWNGIAGLKWIGTGTKRRHQAQASACMDIKLKRAR